MLIKKALPTDTPSLQRFLQAVKLPTSDLPADLSGFSLAFDGDTLVGSAGIEVLDNIGLLRSVAVAETHRKHQLGQTLLTAALEHARSTGLKTVFLITNTAEDYFAKNGFQKIERSNAPMAIAQTEQFSALCPASSAVMKIELN